MPREDILAPGISLGFNLRFLICGIRKMSARRVGSWLFLLSLTGAITSIVWWQNFYNQVMGHAPVNSQARAEWSPVWPAFSMRRPMTRGFCGRAASSLLSASCCSGRRGGTAPLKTFNWLYRRGGETRMAAPPGDFVRPPALL